MQTKLFISSVLFSVFTNAQFNNIDANAINRAGTDIANFVVSLATNTEFSNDINVIATAIPNSVYSQASANPDAFANNFATATTVPAWVSAIPTPVANSLNSILAKPINAENDVDSILAAPQASSIFANTAIPTSVQKAFQSDPAGFIGSLFSASAYPSWASSLPSPLQTSIGSVINQGLSTIAADFESSATPSKSSSRTGTRSASAGTKSAYTTGSTCSPVTVIVTVTAGSSSSSKSSLASTGFPKPSVASAPVAPAAPPASVVATQPGVPKVASPAPSGTAPKGSAASSVAVFSKTSGAPVAFTGAAAPMRTAAVGAAVLFAGAGAFLNV